MATLPAQEVSAPTSGFDALSSLLAAADTAAKTATADAGQARAERSKVATSAILQAVAEKLTPTEVRSKLLKAGVLKGTVSKITTVVQGIYDGNIRREDVKSLNGAYSAVTTTIKSTRLSAIAAASTPVTAPATTPMQAPALKPEDAIKVILDTIKREKNVDKAFKVGGEWITKITNQITDLLREIGEEAEKGE